MKRAQALKGTIICIAGDCEGSVVREPCLLQEWLECDGRITGHHLLGRLLSVLHRGRKPAHLRNPACLPPAQITQAAQSHQPGSRTETGGPDSALFSQTYRKHSAHLLYVLHHFWHFGRPGPDVRKVKNRTDCEADARNQWVNQRYNFDNLGQALMSLFVLSSKDGWVNIMYTGLDAVGVDQQPIVNYNEWRLLYFISFLLLVAFFVLNMFVGVVVENFHRCREEQEKEEKALRAAKRAKKLEKKRRKMREPPYYINYSKPRLLTHNIITSKYFDLAIAAVIGLNVVTMATEFYMMPMELVYALKVFNYFFTAVFILEAAMKIVALGLRRYLADRWNQLDVGIVILSVIGIVLEEMESEVIPINPTIIRIIEGAPPVVTGFYFDRDDCISTEIHKLS
ncbi:voltage-dependent T-type calcium channel subunit alpha-1I [Trichonephila clavata]|uniref:Voltage-dependent T-type calcium channel subunit alpha-1I n=1 Tax=Trichonephila clavata TaxID=2740835 RepID=A0A8X6H9M4_TRICU|nr:voltage-dependent T-type calcium channel subunit alpha-1I [Trichonephila clavata]